MVNLLESALTEIVYLFLYFIIRAERVQHAQAPDIGPYSGGRGAYRGKDPLSSVS